MRALAFLLLFAGCLSAAPKITGATEVKAGGFALLRVDGAEKTVLWTITPEPTQEAEIAGVLVFTGVTGRDYTATAVVIDFENKTATKLKHTVRFGGPEPTPPGPGPQPPTPPQPDPPKPQPIPAAGLHVLIVYERTELAKLPSAQVNALYAKSIREYMDAKCPAGPDGKTKQWRVWDANVDLAGESALWQAAMKRERKSLPWIIVSSDKGGYEGPLPANTADLLALLKKYGE